MTSRLHLCEHEVSLSRKLASPLVCLPKRVQPRHAWRTPHAAGQGNSTFITTTTTATTITTPKSTDSCEADPLCLQQSPELDHLAGPGTELRLLLRLLPSAVRSVLENRPDIEQLVEVVMDLGRPPAARFPHGEEVLSIQPVTADDLTLAVKQVGQFDGDNRAGIDTTLHRISCIRNRGGRVVGLTCRVGRAVPGAAELVRDLVMAGRSVLLLGRPGVGKTTALREVCRIAADDCRQRVIIVDTSNEIGGDGDVPHHSIGGARRLQVPRPEAQHAVMVEAVENHMPQVVVIDEISTEAECAAARTIAQRGVQLVATAHGSRLENVIKNPTLADLVGGIQSVTLGDEEARRRGVQKSILERAAPPTFDVAVEMEERGRWRVHLNVGAAVDTILAGGEAAGQVRFLDGAGHVARANYMGTVRRTDNNGITTTSEWWADEEGDREPLLWPVRQDVNAAAFTTTMSNAPSTASSSSTSTSRLTRSRLSDGGVAIGGQVDARSKTPSTAAATAAASLSAALRANVADAGGRGGNSNNSSTRGSGSGGSNGQGEWERAGVNDPWVAANEADATTKATTLVLPLPPPQLRAYLVMDDDSAARVRAVLGLLRREAYEAAVAAAAAAAAGGHIGCLSGGVGGGPNDGSQNLIELVPDLDMADMVIGTVSKLRKNPKIRNSARKRDLPVYALTATSTSALLRNLCPLLGLDPLAVAEVVRAAGISGSGTAAGVYGGDAAAAAAAEQLLSSSSFDEDSDDGGEGLVGVGAATNGHRRSLELSAADDYADLLATTVRELRYAPLDRSYAQHILARFVEEMTVAGGTTATTTTTGSTLGSVEPPVRASSLAAVAWACSFVKHRKKFVEASRRDLNALAKMCGQRWEEFSSQELLRVAMGFAGLRLAPPSEGWLQSLTAATRNALGVEGMAVDGIVLPNALDADSVMADSRGPERLSADEVSRLQLALAELELLWHEAQRQHAE